MAAVSSKDYPALDSHLHALFAADQQYLEINNPDPSRWFERWPDFQLSTTQSASPFPGAQSQYVSDSSVQQFQADASMISDFGSSSAEAAGASSIMLGNSSSSSTAPRFQTEAIARDREVTIYEQYQEMISAETRTPKVAPSTMVTNFTEPASEMEAQADSIPLASVEPATVLPNDAVIIKRGNEYTIRCRNHGLGCGYSSTLSSDAITSVHDVLQRLKHRERSHHGGTKCSAQRNQTIASPTNGPLSEPESTSPNSPVPSLPRALSNSEGYRLSFVIKNVFDKPSGVAVLQDGSAVVSDRMRHQVVLVNPNGQPTKQMLVSLADPRGVSIDEVNGKLAVADPGRHCVWLQDLASETLIRLGHGKTEGHVHLRFPRDVAVNIVERWLVVADTENNRLVFYAYDGNFLGTWPPQTSNNNLQSPSLARPNGVCVYGNYVLVADKDNNRIVGLQVRFVGGFLSFHLRFQVGRPGTEPGCYKSPHGITVSQGLVFVSDCNNNRVQVFRLEDFTRVTTNGCVVTPVHIIGQAAGQFNQPVGVSVTNCGSKLFICDTHHASVQVYTRV